MCGVSVKKNMNMPGTAQEAIKKNIFSLKYVRERLAFCSVFGVMSKLTKSIFDYFDQF